MKADVDPNSRPHRALWPRAGLRPMARGLEGIALYLHIRLRKHCRKRSYRLLVHIIHRIRQFMKALFRLSHQIHSDNATERQLWPNTATSVTRACQKRRWAKRGPVARITRLFPGSDGGAFG
jgi:hypothetical protein